MDSRGPSDRVRRAVGDALVDSLPEGLWVFDPSGRTCFANDGLTRLLGIRPDEVDGLSVLDACRPEDADSMRRHLRRLAAGAPPPEELRCMLRTGEGDVEVLLVPVPLADGPGGAWLHRVTRPDTCPALVEQLHHRQAQLEEAQSIARIGSFEIDLASGRQTWSDELFRIARLEPQQCDPDLDMMLGFIHPDDRQLALAILEEASRTGGAVDTIVRALRSDGRTAWIHARGRAHHDAAGVPVRITGTAWDVTEHKRNEDALAFLSELAKIANSAGTLLDVLVAADEAVRPFAQWRAVLVGLPAEGANGLRLVDARWSPPDDRLRQEALALAGRVERERRMLVHRPAAGGTVLVGGPVVVGERLACLLISDTLGEHDPHPQDVVVFEQILSLLRHVAERELSARELATARDEALNASRAKSEFLATMSHEIRTPLNGVLGLSELLRGTELTPHQRRLAEGVEQAGRSLLALVDDVLDLSKIEAGRLELEELDFEPAAVVESSASLLAPRARDKGLELVVLCAPTLPRLVRGDPHRFGQVITNLASNAVKFTEAGSVTVRATGSTGPTGPAIRVEVTDTGVGITPEAEPRLFEPFTQADSSTTRRYGGTGLGLAISSRIVSALGGEIGARSEPGAGSTFWFTARFAPPAYDAAPPAGDEGRRRADVGPATRGRVLVAEDNEINQMVAEGVLRGLGYDVVLVGDGAEAVAAYADEPTAFDAILMDCQMPVMDGYDATRAVRRMVGGERLPIIAMTATAFPEERARCLEAGMDDFLTKPVSVELLEGALGRWVRGPLKVTTSRR